MFVAVPKERIAIKRQGRLQVKYDERKSGGQNHTEFEMVKH